VASSTISIVFSAETSMTMPPSLVERPLMPWPPLRTDIATPAWSLANASASATCATLATRSTRPGAPPRI